MRRLANILHEEFSSIFKVQIARLALAPYYIPQKYKQALGQVLLAFSIDSLFVLNWKIFVSYIPYKSHFDFSTYLTIVSIAFAMKGLASFLFYGLQRLPFLIAEQQLTRFLVTPQTPLSLILADEFNMSILGSVLFGFFNLFVLLSFSGIQKILIILLIILGTLIVTAFFLMVASIVFWFPRSALVANLLSEVLNTVTSYPQGHLSWGLILLYYSILPSAWLIQIPLKIIHETSLEPLIAMIAFGLAYLSFSFWIFQKGLKRLKNHL